MRNPFPPLEDIQGRDEFHYHDVTGWYRWDEIERVSPGFCFLLFLPRLLIAELVLNVCLLLLCPSFSLLKLKSLKFFFSRPSSIPYNITFLCTYRQGDNNLSVR